VSNKITPRPLYSREKTPTPTESKAGQVSARVLAFWRTE